MEVNAWSSGSGTYGIRVGVRNRAQWFERGWTQIEVELDGEPRLFKLTPGFWNKCPEFRDSGTTTIREWLRRHRTLHWKRGSPPRMQLVPLGGRKFRLIA